MKTIALLAPVSASGRSILALLGPIAVALLALSAPPSLAQDDGQAYVPRDDQVDASLRQARDLEAKGRIADAVRAYLKAEARLEDLRKIDATTRIVVPHEGTRDVFDGAERAIAARLQALPPAALEAWRADRDPKAEALLARGEALLGDPQPLEELVSRFPLAAAAPRAWDLLADLRLERGAYADALAALESRWSGVEEAALSPEARARLAFARERTRQGEIPASASAWPMEGGAPSRARKPAPGPIPGAPALAAALPIPEAGATVTQGFARRGLPPPLISSAVSDGEPAGGGIYIADSKSVVALDERTRGVRWIYIAVGDGMESPDPPLLPERLENMSFAPAVAGGRVFATLNRNTPPIWPELPPKAKKKKRAPDAEEGDGGAAPGDGERKDGADEGQGKDGDGDKGKDGAEKEPEKPKRRNQPPAAEVVPERRRDFRLVALDATTGRLLWDAAWPSLNGGVPDAPKSTGGAAPAGAPGAGGAAGAAGAGDKSGAVETLPGGGGDKPAGALAMGIPAPAPKKAAPQGAVGALTPTLDELLRNARHVTTPLASGGRVFFGATTQAQGSLQAYAFALDAVTGRPLWRAFLAAGTPEDFRGLASEMAPLALEGGRLIVQTNLGSVAALDPVDGSFLWISRYRSTPAASQKRIIRDDLRFSPSAARVTAGLAITAPQDSGWVHAFDVRDGREAWRFPRDGVRHVAGVSRGRVVLAGTATLVALEGATGRVAWEAPDPPASLRGAPFAAEDRIYVSTEEAIIVYDAASGAREAVLRCGPRGALPGNLTLLGDRLAIVTHDTVILLDPAARSLERLTAATTRNPRDADASLARGTLLARLDEGPFDSAGPGRSAQVSKRAERREKAYAELRRAEELSGPDRPGPTGEARAEAFLLARAAAREAFAAKDEKAALSWTERALAVLRNDPAGLAFVKDAAERLTAMGRPRDAVAVWRKGLELHRNLDVPLGPGIAAPAGPYIRDQLVALRRAHGAAAMIDHDREAAKLLAEAREAGTPEAYQLVLEQGAASESEPAALLALGALYERRNLANVAARFYQRFAERCPEAKEVPTALYRLARLLEKTKRRDEERRVVEIVKERYAQVTAPGDREGERVALGPWSAQRLATLAALADVPSLPTGAEDEPGLARSFQTWTELEADDARILVPPGLDAVSDGVFFVARPGSVEARLCDSGALLWRRDGIDMRGERTGVAQSLQPGGSGGGFLLPGGSIAVVSSGRTVDAVDLATGASRWRWGLPGLVNARKGDAPRTDAPASTTSAAEEEIFPEEPGEREEPGEGAAPAPATPTAAAPGGEVHAPAPTTRTAAQPGARGPASPRGPRPGGKESPEDQLVRAKDALTALETLVDPDPMKGLSVIGDRVVIVLGKDVIALDIESGEVAWRVRRTESLYRDPIAVDPPRGSKIGTRVLLASESPARLIALDLASGAESWSLSLGDRDPRITVAPVASRGGRRIFCGVASSDLVAVDGVAGIQIWRRRLPFYTRELVAARDGSAVAIVAHPLPDQPRLAVFDGGSGAPAFEEKAEKNRIGPVAFDGDRLYYFAGDMITGRVRAVDWRTGQVRWMWTPQRGQSFGELIVARDHLILPQTAPTGGAVVFLLDKERGGIFRTFPIEGRRIQTASVVRGSLIVATTRGLTGYARIDPQRLKEELADAAIAAAKRPGDALLRARIADRRFKLGDIEGAIDAAEQGLLEANTLATYEMLERQLMGHVDARPATERVEISRMARAPEIDGDLRDVWPFQQSVALDRPRNVQPIQGYARPGILRGKEDLSATLYLGYDDRYFYFALDVEDSFLTPYDSEKDEWRGDCLLIAIDALGNGGDGFQRDDNLLSLALTLPKKNKKPEEEQEDEEDEPDGRYFVKRKDDGTGAVYEGAIPWRAFIEHQADIDPVHGPKEGFTFGFDVIVTDDDDGDGAKKALSWTPGVTLHREKRKLWNGFVPGRFGKIICR